MPDGACVVQCMASLYSKFFVFVRSHKNDKLAFLKNPTLGTVKMPEIPFTCGRKAKLRKESLFSKIPGYVWTRPKVSL